MAIATGLRYQELAEAVNHPLQRVEPAIMPTIDVKLNDFEKDIMSFLFAEIGHDAAATCSLKQVQRSFPKMDNGAFWLSCTDLIDKELISNDIRDEVALSSQGWVVARKLCVGQQQPKKQVPETASLRKDEQLVWELDALSDPDRAGRFASRCRKAFSVYSPQTTQIYARYEILIPTGGPRRLLIMPNRHAVQDIFARIPSGAITPTNLFVKAGEGNEIHMVMQMTNQKQHVLPLDVGLKLVQQKLGPNNPFLPVLAKGNLREIEPAVPVMHLHRLQLDKIDDYSEEERFSLSRILQDNIVGEFGRYR